MMEGYTYKSNREISAAREQDQVAGIRARYLVDIIDDFAVEDLVRLGRQRPVVVSDRSQRVS